METIPAPKIKAVHFANCPVCGKERRTNPTTGFMLGHRMWIPRRKLLANPSAYSNIEPYEYGRMVPCLGHISYNSQRKNLNAI